MTSAMAQKNAQAPIESKDSGGTCGCGAPDSVATERPNILKVLVAIANHGTKNSRFLERLIAEYRAMKGYAVDIVILSNIPKTLGQDIEVKVGLPIEDPWSLPFGYKALFAERAAAYDLFIYSEDDTLVTEKNIDAFVEETRFLPDEYIAGFMRYEVSQDGSGYFPDMHSHYHWEPNSVMRFGNSLFAYYTNEHAACFMLTRQQLHKAIDSGGFMLPPRRGRYDMLVTAATDPYTHCGMKKLICISRMDDFSIHHLPNVYCGELGLDRKSAHIEIKHLTSLASEKPDLPQGPLFKPFPLRDGDGWIKIYYEGRRDDVLKCVPRNARRVLSVGCACGTTEAALVSRGIEVVGIPLDAIIGTTAGMKGIAVLPPDFDLAAEELKGQWFDCIIMMDILQQLQDPVAIIRRYRGFLQDGGTMLVSVSNWNYLGTLRRRLTRNGRATLECRATAQNAGVHQTTRSCVDGWLRQGGFRRIKHCGDAMAGLEWVGKLTFGLADGFLSRKLLISAQQ